MEDRRAHERIDNLEDVVKKHFSDHIRFEQALLQNTEMTSKIVENTAPYY